jgi:hypothetical protein
VSGRAPDTTTRRRPGLFLAAVLGSLTVAAFCYPAVSSSAAALAVDVLHYGRSFSAGGADGVLPARTTVFDNDVAGVANIDSALLAALRRAAANARPAGIEFLLNSGWRSPRYQAHLFRAAVSTYGSEREAARWVARPDTSAHVSGHAVDLAPEASGWLSRHGAKYGLCRVYTNEPWHYELRPHAATRGCPPRYADAAHDPRMHP